ncbi:MAG: heavy-metal-associated domain-containing protein [Magnetospirillum sp.]|nr:heavy-metal-associated domain-containing protein [Magnetospirillum sp.]
MTATFRVTGMTCGGCARSVESAIKAAAPGASVSVDLAAAAVKVDGATAEQVKKAVDEAGFGFEGAV